ncbi:hypothetical protein [Pontibacter virosus]|uniref:Beta-barrel assembly machine subunit BamE n=1 Tax=Pontibacter virosus TaxID=1765052 RepID=A0A2U1AX11_9BACT|nr:hypothetical protein [Pontibacter virosus]PVY40932.1 hypothetical protein C8E01_106274 [Pontibacter virosus]
MKKSYLFVFAIVALIVSCKVSKQATNQIGTTIVEGNGVQGINVGDNISNVLKITGKPSKTDEEYYNFYDKGIEFTVAGNQVRTIFLYYISNKYQPFNGQTDKGINKESTIEDVLKNYGEPDRIGQSIISSGSAFAGQEDYNMNYYSKGITFTFYNKKLADIRIYKPE